MHRLVLRVIAPFHSSFSRSPVFTIDELMTSSIHDKPNPIYMQMQLSLSSINLQSTVSNQFFLIRSHPLMLSKSNMYIIEVVLSSDTFSTFSLVNSNIINISRPLLPKRKTSDHGLHKLVHSNSKMVCSLIIHVYQLYMYMNQLGVSQSRICMRVSLYGVVV